MKYDLIFTIYFQREIFVNRNLYIVKINKTSLNGQTLINQSITI